MGVNPAESGREGAHPGRARPEVLGRQRAEVRRQGRLAAPGHVSSEDRRGAATSGPRACRLGVDWSADGAAAPSRSRTSPTVSPRPSSASGASSSSGSTRSSTCSRSSCAARPCSAASTPPRRASGSAAGSSTRSRRTPSRSSRSRRSSRRSASTACARVRAGVRVRTGGRADRHRRREARRHRLDRARVRRGVPRGARGRPAARGRAHGQLVSRPRRGRALPRRLPARGGGNLLPRQDLERGRRATSRT